MASELARQVAEKLANNEVTDAAEIEGTTYTPTNVTESRTFDADTVDVAGLADIVGTLISDLQMRDVIH